MIPITPLEFRVRREILNLSPEWFAGFLTGQGNFTEPADIQKWEQAEETLPQYARDGLLLVESKTSETMATIVLRLSAAAPTGVVTGINAMIPATDEELWNMVPELGGLPVAWYERMFILTALAHDLPIRMFPM